MTNDGVVYSSVEALSRSERRSTPCSGITSKSNPNLRILLNAGR